MTKEQIIEIMVKWQPEIIFRDEYNTVASELQQLFDEQLKGCWQAGVEYGSNRTDKNFNDFKEQEEKK